MEYGIEESMSYYRCTHKSFYGCKAKKHVQRLDEDPHTYEVTYKGCHTCNTSTVPLIPGPHAALEQLREMVGAKGNSSSRWLSMGMGAEAGEKEMRNARAHPHVRAQDHARGVDVEFGKEMEALDDYTDVLFNYGSSSNSLNAIFPSRKDN
ncbi:DNA binding domain [Asimina triloba]